MEIWKDIPGYEGLYQVSDCGRIKSLNYRRTKQECIMKPRVAHGYQYVKLFKDKLRKLVKVHRLVAQVFIPNPDNKPEVNHINGIKTDNRAENLEWTTHSENQLHAYRNGLQKQNSKSVLQYDLQDNFLKSFESIAAAVNETKVHRGCISECCTGKRKTAGGYHWEYSKN